MELATFEDVNIGRLSLGAAAMAALVFGVFAQPLPGLTPTTQTVLSLLLFTILLWMSELVRYEVSCVVSVALLVLLGASSVRTAISGFYTTLVLFLILLLLLGRGAINVELDKRGASEFLARTGSPSNSLYSMSRYLFVLGFIIPSALARTMAFVPVLDRISEVYDLESSHNYNKVALYLLGHANPLISMALMTGGGIAIVSSGFIQSTVQPISWLDWSLYMLPPVVLTYSMSTIAVIVLYPIRVPVSEVPAYDADVADDENAAEVLGQQRQFIRILLAMIVAWVASSIVGFPPLIPALVAVVLLFSPPLRILKPGDLLSINWGVIFIVGTMLTYIEVMTETDLLEMFIGLFEYVPTQSMESWQVVLVILVMCVAIRVPFSTAMAPLSVALPIFLALSGPIGVNGLYLGFAIMMVISSFTILPYNSTPALIAFEFGGLRYRDVALFGTITIVSAVVTIFVAWEYYWPLVDRIVYVI